MLSQYHLMAQISQLYIYPVKSLGGIGLQQAQVTSRGLEHDRRWMLIDEHNRFLSQRSHPQLALFALAVTPVGIEVTHKPTQASIIIPYQPQASEKITVSIWDDNCSATVVSEEINQWFSHILQINCRLVYMGNDDLRPVDPKYAGAEHITSFSDAYPMLLIGQSSLDDLNSRLNQAVPMDRFRPNMVIDGTAPYEEDLMTHFTTSDIDFYGVKPCARCVMTTIDQDTALGGAEPLKILSGYRQANKKIYFGQNLIHHGEGIIKVGDVIEIKKLGPELKFD